MGLKGLFFFNCKSQVEKAAMIINNDGTLEEIKEKASDVLETYLKGY